MRCMWCRRDIEKDRIELSNILGVKGREDEICVNCRNIFQPINWENACCQCGKRIGEREKICLDCLRWQQDGEELIVTPLFSYDDCAKEWESRYKFMGDCRVAKMFKPILLHYFQKKNRLIVPIPTSKQSYLRRGFDPNLYILNTCQIHFLDILEIESSGKKQSEKTRAERLQLGNVFSLKRNVVCEDRLQKLLLFDDIYTTGTTIRRATAALKKAGWQDIEAITLFR